MKPIKKCDLPKNSNFVSIYLNGSRLGNNYGTFILEKILYLPVQKISSYLDFKTSEKNDSVVVEGNNRKFELALGGVKDITNDVDYSKYRVRNIGSTLYVETAFFEDELGVTIAWEEETNSLYLATVLHYDGYRVAPMEIYEKNPLNKQYDGKFLFIDGIAIAQKDNIIIVKNNDGLIYFTSYFTKKLTENHIYRFCFSYKYEEYVDGVPVGRLMELVEPKNQFRIGNMIYTEDSFNSFSEDESVEIDDEDEKVGLDNELLVGMFKQYPNILSDRKKLQSYLRDTFPQDVLEVNLFLVAYDIGIVQAIDESELNDLFVHRMVKKLVDENGIQEDNAIKTICKWCETYGDRILGKKFYSIKKYSASIQAELIARGAKWKSPQMNTDREFGDIIYNEPKGWRTKEAKSPHEGTYYYPYETNETGMIWVSRSRNPGNEDLGEPEYTSIISGMVGDLDNLISVKEFEIAGRKGRKVNYNKEVLGNVMELNTYMVPISEYIYFFWFGEKNGICNEMIMFEEDFINNVKIKGI